MEICPWFLTLRSVHHTVDVINLQIPSMQMKSVPECSSRRGGGAAAVEQQLDQQLAFVELKFVPFPDQLSCSYYLSFVVVEEISHGK